MNFIYCMLTFRKVSINNVLGSKKYIYTKDKIWKQEKLQRANIYYVYSIVPATV